MKKIVTLVFSCIVLVSCKQKITIADLDKINGYWEITKATNPDGEDKEYTINETYDYFKIVNNKGIRKKVKPQLDGSFIVNDTYENIRITEKESTFYIDYKTNYSQWSEEIITLTDSILVLKTKDDTNYYYKKTAAINLN